MDIRDIVAEKTTDTPLWNLLYGLRTIHTYLTAGREAGAGGDGEAAPLLPLKNRGRGGKNAL